MPRLRLLQHFHTRTTAILAGARICETLARYIRKTESIVKFTVGEQAGVGRDDWSAKLEHHPAGEIQPERLAARLTRRLRRDSRLHTSITL